MKRILLVVLICGVAVAVAVAIRMHSRGSVASDAKQAPRAKQLWTCKMHPQIVQDHPGLCPICGMPLTPLVTAAPHGELLKAMPEGNPDSAGPTVEIDPVVVQNMGVRIAKVTRGSLQKSIRAVGMLEVPQSAQHEVNLRIGGWIEKLYANQEGMHVHPGDVLFDLYSPDLQIAQEELIGAAAAEKSLDPKSAGNAKSESQSLLQSARRKLQQWGVADRDIDAIAAAGKASSTVPFRSPADGEIQDKMIVEGAAVQAGMKVLRLEDHSKLWLQAQIFEQQIAMIKLGQQAQATVESAPGKVFSGPVDFIYPHLDHASRTIAVRITLDNPDHQLKPGMYATVSVLTQPAADALLVPREAVIDTGARQIVFVALADGHFDPRIVHMGFAGDNDQVQILDGLKEGDSVVTSGQFLMDVTSRTAEAMQKLSATTRKK